MGSVKTAGVLYNAKLRDNAVANAGKFAWAADIQKKIVAQAEPWMGLSDDELWDLMFGATIPRAWMVWSDGHCPACGTSVPMYSWKFDGHKMPWKTQCPHCEELFPKNDFHAYYRTGLDEHGVFDPRLADRSLLFSAEHPDPSDPLHQFGVDDGWGYMEGDKRWRFIGYYLIRGQWKELVVAGIDRLAAAYVVTNDASYAHKAAILLDRVADLHPTFDFKTQAWVYEVQDANGYESTWHDACNEIRRMADAYDQVFDGIRDDAALVEFLSAKAKQFKLDNPKASFADVQRNIEDGILRDTLANEHKIHSNVPHTEETIATIKTVLGWPGNRDEVNELLDQIFAHATAVDGLVGEKGMTAYAATGPHTTAPLLSTYARIMPGFLAETIKRCPRLVDGFRFYFDVWCLQKFYPNIGDSNPMGRPTGYKAVGFNRGGGIYPSAFTFFYQLYELTGDPAYVQALYLANGSSTEGLPHDIFVEDSEEFQKSVQEVIDRVGTEVKVGCVDKKEWRLAILRSGEGSNGRAAWLDYDSGGEHAHFDGMNIGLFAKGLDLMADNGYPPVQYGGWWAPQVDWYRSSASHNTVTIDGGKRDHHFDTTTLWAIGDQVKATRASADEFDSVKQFERTIVMVDISESDSYLLDIFRVVGGSDHAKFMHSNYATMSTTGLALSPAKEFGHGTFMRDFMTDCAAKPGWTADWALKDRFEVLPAGSEVHLRYIDLTNDAEASTCEGWVSPNGCESSEEAWIPRLMVRRQGESPLSSTFAGVIEPYEGKSSVVSARRLPLETPGGSTFPDSNVAIEVTLADGRRDVLIAADVQNVSGLTPSLASDSVLVQKELGIHLEGELCLVRFGKAGEVERVFACKGRSVSIGSARFDLGNDADWLEAVPTPD